MEAQSENKRITPAPEARLNQWEGKAGSVWRVAQATKEEEVGKQDCYSLSQVINLTEQYTGHLNGKTLTATLPKGKWKLLRMGHTATGHTNATGGGGKRIGM